jgi:hypothetical protein
MNLYTLFYQREYIKATIKNFYGFKARFTYLASNFPEPSPLIIPLITSSPQYISALTFLIRGQGAGLAGAAAHQHEHIHPFAALGAFDLRKSGGVLSFVASI